MAEPGFGKKRKPMKFNAIIIMGAILVVLAAIFFISRDVPESESRETSRQFIWSFGMQDLTHIEINLPPEGKREAWVKHEDRSWYFDRANGPKVNNKRWGGGIPLLLSGPGAQRLIDKAATDEQLRIYGFMDPKMTISLLLQNGDVINVEVGDKTLDAQAYYIRRADSRAVYTVDHTWYDVLEHLVMAPPYPEAESRR